MSLSSCRPSSLPAAAGRILATKYSFLMSNAERQVQNEEEGIRESYESRVTTNKVLVHCTWYLVLRTILLLAT